MTECDSELYTVSMVIPVQKKVRATNEADARDQVLREQVVIASIGVSVGFPQELNVVKEYSGHHGAADEGNS